MSRLCSAALLLVVFAAAPAVAATPGFVEDFSTDTGGFGVGGSSVTRVLSGGVGGVSDPYISISNAAVSFLGSFTQAPEFVGNLTADGVTGFSFWLRDTGANDNFQIHVGVGLAFSNFWLSVPGFVPPDGSWQQFTVDVTDPSQWVRIIGSGTFQQALASTDRVLFRHDVPPLVQMPEAVTGDFGLDRIQVLPAAASVPAISDPGRALLGLLVVAVAGFVLHRRHRLALAS